MNCKAFYYFNFALQSHHCYHYKHGLDTLSCILLMASSLPLQSNAGKMCKILKDVSIEQNHKPGLYHCGFCGANSDSFQILSHESESSRGKSSLIDNGGVEKKRKVTNSGPNSSSGLLLCMHIQNMVMCALVLFFCIWSTALKLVVHCVYCNCYIVYL